MYNIGIDLGGTNIKVGIVDQKGKIIIKNSVSTQAHDPDAVISAMADLSVELLENSKISIDEIEYIGIGIPGTIDSKSGIIVYSNNLNFRNYPIVEKLQRYINKPIFISNDANVAALGEYVAGGAKEYNSAVVVTLGTGVGGGIILDGKIWEGYKSAGAEIGHMVIQVEGEQCSCGRKGCWEAYSSASALIRESKRAIDKYPDSTMCDIAKKDGKVSGRTAFLAAKENDVAGKEVVDTYIKYLANGIANIMSLIAPEVILLGGGVSNEGENLLKPLRAKIDSMVYGGANVDHPKIKLATLGNDAGLIGAAMLGR